MNDLPDGLMDVPRVAEYLRVSKTSVYGLIERQEIPAIRIGRSLMQTVGKTYYRNLHFL